MPRQKTTHLVLLIGFPHADMVEVWDESPLTLNYSRSAMQTVAKLRRLGYFALAATAKEAAPKIKQIIASCAPGLAQEADALESAVQRRFLSEMRQMTMHPLLAITTIQVDSDKFVAGTHVQ